MFTGFLPQFFILDLLYPFLVPLLFILQVLFQSSALSLGCYCWLERVLRLLIVLLALLLDPFHCQLFLFLFLNLQASLINWLNYFLSTRPQDIRHERQLFQLLFLLHVVLMFSPHNASLLPLIVSYQKVDKRLRNLFLPLRCFSLVAPLTEVKIIRGEIFLSYWCCRIEERRLARVDILEIVQMQLLMVDFRHILGIKDFVHEFFSGLLKLLNEGRVLIFIVSSGFEEIVFIEMVFCHQMKQFQLLQSIDFIE